MSEKIDILSFCRILTDLTNKDKCDWHPTSYTSRDRLVFDTGYLEITLYQESLESQKSEERKKWYCIDIYNKDDEQCIPYIAEKGVDNEAFVVFGDLYKAIWAYYIRTRNERISSFLNEIMEHSSK